MTVVGQARTLQPDHLRLPRDVQGRALTEQDARAEANRKSVNRKSQILMDVQLDSVYHFFSWNTHLQRAGADLPLASAGSGIV